MRNSIRKFFLNLSFILPGSSQIINGETQKGLSLAVSAAVGITMFFLGNEKVSSLGFLVIAITWMTNFTDIVNQAFRHIVQDLNEIAVSLERIANKLEVISLQLKEISLALPELERRIMILQKTAGLKLLPPGEQYLLLPSPTVKEVDRENKIRESRVD